MLSWNEKLISAATNGSIHDLKLCIENKADLEYYEGYDGPTALMLAVLKGRLKVTNILLKHGCKKEVRNKNRRTPLILAAMNGRLKITKVLLDNGCFKEAKDDKNHTALMWAAKGGYLEVTKILLAFGCDKEAKDEHDYTVFILAALSGKLEVTKLLIDNHCNKMATSYKREGALHLTAIGGHLDVTKYLVENGCSPLDKTDEGMTPYDLAATENILDSDDIKRRKQEVLHFLKTVMPTDAEDANPRISLQTQSIPTVEVIQDQDISQSLNAVTAADTAICTNNSATCCLEQKQSEAASHRPENVFEISNGSTEYYLTTETTNTSSAKVNVKIERTTSSNVSVAHTSIDGLTAEELKYATMGMIVLNILADVLFDLLQQDKHNIPSRNNCDITYLYSELRKMNKHIPSSSTHRSCPPGPWGGEWKDRNDTDKAIGDDIERIRLTRNELQHSRTFELDDTRFNELYSIIYDLLNRFDQHNKPAKPYVSYLKEVIQKMRSEEEMKAFYHQLLKNERKSEISFNFEFNARLFSTQ